MQYLKATLQSHPNPVTQLTERLPELLATLSECALTCRACADACLSEDSVEELTDCIRSDILCAEVCQTFANLLTYPGTPDDLVLRGLADVCEDACRACADDCEEHAERHEHCAQCARICRECERACSELVAAV